MFTLIVYDLGVKYVGKEHADHLKYVLEETYKVTSDWTGIHMLAFISIGTTATYKCTCIYQAMSK